MDVIGLESNSFPQASRSAALFLSAFSPYRRAHINGDGSCGTVRSGSGRVHHVLDNIMSFNTYFEM